MKVSRTNRIQLVALTTCAILLFTGAVLTQTKKPISKKGLINAVKIKGLSTSELVQDIQNRGVDFQMTEAIESELRRAGATTEVIEAARANYRPKRGKSRT